MDITRRELVGTLAGAAVVAAGARNASAQEPAIGSGPIKHSVCYWCYQKNLTLDELCAGAKAIGMQSVELLDVDQFDVVKQYGLICAMANGPGPIKEGWNRIERHDELVAKSEEILPKVAEAGFPNMIVFSGNRDGMDDAEGLKNCAKGLKRITALAEQLGVTVCMELLNSKRDHNDYMCDHTAWGVNLVNEIGSDRFKLLYDIYHMQIMDGDIVATIQENIDAIGHFHTGGVPGRHEIDETQELNYRRIVKGIRDTGFTGYLAQEFIPANDPLTSLKQAVHICNV